jgi:DNA-binding MarR family transcriptional regulator
MQEKTTLHTGPQDDVQPVETRGPGFLFRRLQQVSVSFFHEQLRPLGLTPLQATVLRILGNEDGLDQLSIASRAVVDSSTIKDVVHRLEQNKALIRIRSNLDRRMQLVYLTPHGRELLRSSDPLAQVAAEKLLAPLSEQEREQLLATVAKLVAAHDAPAEFGLRAAWRRRKPT